MIYDAAYCLLQELIAAQVVWSPAVAHTVIAADSIAPGGDNTLVKRPAILLELPIAQPRPGVQGNGPHSQQLVRNKTRLAIRVLSRRTVQNVATLKEVSGVRAEHQNAVAFVWDYIKNHAAVAVPSDLQASIGDQPLGMEPETPFGGAGGSDKEGFRHVFFVVIDTLEVLWPL